MKYRIEFEEDNYSWGCPVLNEVGGIPLCRIASKDHPCGRACPGVGLPDCPAMKVERCKWTFDEHHDKYDTECGEAHCFMSEGPTENDHKYCPYCGREIEVVK
jgi:hypothetical protein